MDKIVAALELFEKLRSPIDYDEAVVEAQLEKLKSEMTTAECTVYDLAVESFNKGFHLASCMIAGSPD